MDRRARPVKWRESLRDFEERKEGLHCCTVAGALAPAGAVGVAAGAGLGRLFIWEG